MSKLLNDISQSVISGVMFALVFIFLESLYAKWQHRKKHKRLIKKIFVPKERIEDETPMTIEVKNSRTGRKVNIVVDLYTGAYIITEP